MQTPCARNAAFEDDAVPRLVPRAAPAAPRLEHRFDWMKRREFVSLLGGVAAWPLAARAQSVGGLDPRTTPARGDLAAKQLAGVVEAPRFVEGTAYEIGAPQAPMRKAPSHAAELRTQALMGERLTIYDIDGEGWAWEQLADDGYVGYV